MDNNIHNPAEPTYKDIQSIIYDGLIEVDKRQQNGIITGIPSGFSEIDFCTGGWQKGDLILIASRPGVGKTTFSLNMARNVAIDSKIPVAYFSLAEDYLSISNRLLCAESGITMKKLSGSEKMDENDWKELEAKSANFTYVPLFIEYTFHLCIDDFVEKAKSLCTNEHISLIIIDELQLMRDSHNSRDFGDIISTLKRLAMELNVAIIVTAQLLRPTKNNNDDLYKVIPGLSFEAISEYVDVLAYINLTSYQLVKTELNRRSISFVKNRCGSCATINMYFIAEKLKFVQEIDMLCSSLVKSPIEIV